MAAKSFLREVAGGFSRVFGVQISSGAANAGDIAALGDDGRFDASLLPPANVRTKHSWDFLANNTIVQPWSGTAISGGSNGSLAGAAEHVGHPGITIFTASTTANSGYRYNTFTTQINPKGGEVSRFIFHVVSGLAATSNLVMGFITSGTHLAGSDEILLNISGLVATGRCTNNSASTTSSTIATLSANTWYRGKIEVAADGASATFSIFSNSGTLIGSQTVSANLPTGGARRMGHGIVVTSSGTTSGSIALLDYMDYEEPLLDRAF